VVLRGSEAAKFVDVESTSISQDSFGKPADTPKVVQEVAVREQETLSFFLTLANLSAEDRIGEAVGPLDPY